MKRVADLRAYIESRFPCVEGLAAARCQTGDPYVVIGAQAVSEPPPAVPGTVDEGRARESATDEETAVMQALGCFDTYAVDRKGTLYWRKYPAWEVERGARGRPRREGRRASVYLRLVISDKPRRFETIDAVLASER